MWQFRKRWSLFLGSKLKLVQILRYLKKKKKKKKKSTNGDTPVLTEEIMLN